ncbi:MAG: metal ABC transporter ATP-binding protein [Actinomycetes bacterium]
MTTHSPEAPVVELADAAVQLGGRTIWSGLDLRVMPGEFLAVLGPNGAGKTTFVRVLLGLTPLSAGRVEVLGEPVRRGSRHIGYVPQQRGFDRSLPLRGSDLVRLGLDGHRWGPGWPDPRRKAAVRRAIDEVGAHAYADRPIGLVSGGEQQRLRVAAAVVDDPALVLADEPLLSLDMRHQQGVVALLDARRRAAGSAVVFVTHEINPVLPYVDRVLYLAAGRHVVGTPDEVLSSATLTALYDAPVDVLRVRGRVLVVGTPDQAAHDHGEHVDAVPDATASGALPQLPGQV